MKSKKSIRNLPSHFQEEENQLRLKGINNWLELKSLNDEELFGIVQKSRASTRNLIRLRGMATLICEINISQIEAALLLHAGIASITALASMTPSELIHKTSRLERQLRTERKPYVDLIKAQSWIKSAKKAKCEPN